MEPIAAKPTLRDSRRLHTVGRLLNEPLMGLLALTALALALVPVLFSIPDQVDRAFDQVEWGIVAVFAAEYLVHLILAPDRRRYVTDGWRLLDLLTIVAPLLSPLPQVADELRSAPLLRLLRLFRAVMFGARAGGAVARDRARRAAAPATGPPSAFLLRRGAARRPLSRPELLQWLGEPDDAWCEVSNLSASDLEEIAHAAGLQPSLLDANLFQASYPHAHRVDGFLVLFLWYPSLRPPGDLDRQGVLVLAGDRGLTSLSAQSTALQEVVRVDPADPPLSAALPVAILRSVLKAHEELTGHFERALRGLEEVPVPEGRAEFLQQTFWLKKQLSTMHADLWRIRRVLDSLPSATSASSTSLGTLRDEAEYLYDTVSHIRQGVISLIELHLNVVSFEMNKVMRVLAIVSVLGLVPAVVGGLLGMNVHGTPWAVTLPQVTFGVSMGMLVCLYIFYVRGWLR